MANSGTGQGVRDLEQFYRATRAGEQTGVAALLRDTAERIGRRVARTGLTAALGLGTARQGARTAAPLPPHYRIIEMIGPSCVGKSTLQKEALGQMACDWQPRAPVRPVKPAAPTAIDDPGLEAILAQRLEYATRSGTTVAERLADLRVDCATLESDYAVRAAVASGEVGFFLDEGLCKRFFGQLRHLDDALLRQCLARRAMVFVAVREPEIALLRIGKRAQGGQMLRGYADCASIGDVRDKLNRRIAAERTLEARCRAIGTPVLRLDADDPLEENVAALCRFEQQLLTAQP